MPDGDFEQIAASNDVRPVRLFTECKRAREREAALEVMVRRLCEAHWDDATHNDVRIIVRDAEMLLKESE